MRLPSASGHVPQVEKEQTWLPRLAPQLPLPVPEVCGAGRASATFPAPWSDYRWIVGRRPSPAEIKDDARFASDLAGFLVALRSADTAGAPGRGLHSAFRGSPPEHWDRGWALWKALIMLTNKPPAQAELARHVLDELFSER